MKLFPVNCCIAVLAAVCHSVAADQVEEVVVTATLFSQNAEALNHPVNVLSGDALKNAASATLGETLKNELGVSSSSFGPGVGLPVIRGQSDNRVKVMQDSVGSMDASSASPDHAITLEPLLATKIEVLRGPAALRYGSGAIGGVVNVLDNRIPSEQPDNGLEGGVELRHGSVNNETVGVGSATVGFGNVALHVDAMQRDSDEMKIPGMAQTNPAASDNSSQGVVANTDTNASSQTLGVSYIGESGFIGLSTNSLDNNYGVPPDSAELVRIDLHQRRYDIKGELNSPLNYIEKISGHLGHNDYAHSEIEDGEPGTRFTNQAFEGRLEALHAPIANWHGQFGLQLAQSTFAAVGEEAFIPKSDIHTTGLFIAEEYATGDWRYELGARADAQSIAPDSAARLRHNSSNFSTSANWEFIEQQQLRFGLSQSQRAPSIEELLANGPHPATGSFLLGDAKLKNETSLNMELGYKGQWDRWHGSLNIYRNQVTHFIFADNLNTEIEDLTVYQYTQADATFEGYEVEVKYVIADTWQARVFADQVRAKLNSGTDLPRITPARLGGAVEYHGTHWGGGISSLRAAKQNHPGAFETPTAGSNRLDANLDYEFSKLKTQYTVFIKLTNILNAEIRNPTSYLRDVAPEAGRNIQAGVRLRF